jgi:CDP-diacylglycerol---serine O-phosphatidyltransferase
MNLKVADIATLLSLIASVIALFFTQQNMIVFAAIALIAAVIFDFLDGKIARAMNQASEFGMYLDSLVDILSFGAMPVAIAFSLLGPSWILIVTSVIYLAGGAYRLARFQATKLKGEFQGMPITLNGIFFAGLLFVPRKDIALPIYFVIASLLMVSTFKVKKL